MCRMLAMVGMGVCVLANSTGCVFDKVSTALDNAPVIVSELQLILAQLQSFSAGLQ